MKTWMIRVSLFVAIMAVGALVRAEDVAADLAKAAQNPVGDLISVPFQYNVNFGVGPDDGEQSVLNIQPIYPMNLTKDWTLINRLIIPIIDQPAPVNESGLGDIQYQGFITPADPKGFVWGAGPVVSFPTASKDALGSEKWSAGAGAVVLKMAGPWVVGGVLNNIWSVAGEDERTDVNALFLQYFVNYNFPSFYLTSAPVITSNWEADSDDRWTVPFGGGLGKIIRIGALPPLNCQLSAYYNVEHPDAAAEWQGRLQVQLMFPK
jgi:hypothetical protein